MGKIKEFFVNNKNHIISAVVSVCASLVASLVVVIWNNNGTIARIDQSNSDLNIRIDDVNKRIDDAGVITDTKIEAISKDVKRIDDSISSLSDKIDNLSSSVFRTEGRLFSLTITDDGPLVNAIKELSFQKNSDVYYSGLSFDDEIIATDENNVEYTVKELQNIPFLIYYTEAGKDVFFCGQFDEDSMWTGNCLINVYANGKLEIATEALYSHGDRCVYQQLFPDSDKWVFSSRIDNGDHNSGDTWIYKKYDDIEQTILANHPVSGAMVHPSDISVGEFIPLLSHYHGNTSDGKYNDDSGTAYLISYFEDGYVRLFYTGCFVDGKPDDQSGTAWQIARSQNPDTDYMLYKGIFEGGEQIQGIDEASDWENPLTESKLNEYTSELSYVDELKLDMDYIVFE